MRVERWTLGQGKYQVVTVHRKLKKKNMQLITYHEQAEKAASTQASEKRQQTIL